MFVGWNPALLDVFGAVIVIGVLIFVHELGHFLAAKAVGIAVLRFSFGLGPRTPLGVKIGETDYCLSWIPFGGFVKMAGLEEEATTEAMEGGRMEAEVPRERTFDAKPLWQRIVVILAGVTMNAVFAFALYAGLSAHYGRTVYRTTTVARVDTAGLPMGAAGLASLRPGDRIERINGAPVETWDGVQRALLGAPGSRITIDVAGRASPVLLDVPAAEDSSRARLAGALVPWLDPVIGAVIEGEPAAAAGLRAGDRILSVSGALTPSWDSVVRIVQRSAARPLAIVVGRDGAELPLTVKPAALRVPGGSGAGAVIGRIGAEVYVPVERFGFAGSLAEGWRRTVSAGSLILTTLEGLVTGRVSVRELGGPILIGQVSGAVARLGLEPFLTFVALFSINLAILNLLPIPVLDGGHLVFLIYEGVRGRPMPLAQRQRLTQIGFVVLVGIMVLALANDFVRLLK